MTTFLFEEIKTIREYAPKAYKELPKYVVHNLTQKYQIRPYQEQAFRNFITYFEMIDYVIDLHKSYSTWLLVAVKL